MRFLRTSPRARQVVSGIVSTVLATSLLAGSAAGVAAKQKPDTPPGSIDIQLLAINDFHGQLPTGQTLKVPTDPTTTTSVPVGGIVYLAQQVKALEAQNPHTLLLSAGDLIGASPMVSALFHDEPTIEAMNQLGMDYAVVGNHEFDEGLAELYRMQNGGCNPVDGCQTGHTFAGADFPYLAANVIGPNGKPIFSPYKIASVAGAKIGIIGVVTTETPSIVMPSAVAGLTFLPEQATVNKYAKVLEAKGVNTIVVLLHDGTGSGPGVLNDLDATVNTCPTSMVAGNSFYDLVAGMDSAVKVVFSAHSHATYNCKVGDKIVTQASSAGRVLTDVDITVKRSTDEMTAASAHNIAVTNTGTPDPKATSLLAYYNNLVAPIQNRVIGSVTADITRTPNGAGESALGDVIADAQLAATSSPTTGNAVVAMTNSGGVRTDILYNQISGGEQAGQVTYGEAFAVQPFYNILYTRTYTGAQLKDILEQQATASGGRLQISHSLTYDWSASAPTGSKVLNLKIDGVAVDPTASYRVTMNNFIATGGDQFTNFTVGTDTLVGEVDLDALVAYFEANSPVAPGPQNRVTLVP